MRRNQIWRKVKKKNKKNTLEWKSKVMRLPVARASCFVCHNIFRINKNNGWGGCQGLALGEIDFMCCTRAKIRTEQHEELIGFGYLIVNPPPAPLPRTSKKSHHKIVDHLLLPLVGYQEQWWYPVFLDFCYYICSTFCVKYPHRYTLRVTRMR